MFFIWTCYDKEIWAKGKCVVYVPHVTVLWTNLDSSFNNFEIWHEENYNTGG